MQKTVILVILLASYLASAAFVPTNVCSGKNGVLLPAKDCTKYLQCDHGHPLLRDCNAGTQFNPNSNQCDLRRGDTCII